MVKEAHEHRIEIFPWTVNGERALRDVLRMGVDGFVTDDPVSYTHLTLPTN